MMEESGSGADLKLTERLQLLQEWQEEQRLKLLEQQRLQYESLRQEQEKIQHVLTIKKALSTSPVADVCGNGKCSSGYRPAPASAPSVSPEVKAPPTTNDVTPPSPLALTDSSPSERIQRAAQLRFLLQEARLGQQGLSSSASGSPSGRDRSVSSVSETGRSEVDGVTPLPDTASSDGHSDSGEHKSVRLRSRRHDYRARKLLEESIPRNEAVVKRPIPEHLKQGGYDDRPINPGLSGQVKNFEDFVEMQMKAWSVLGESPVAQGDSPQLKVSPKHTFLRKGHGLTRYTVGGLSPRAPISRSPKSFTMITNKCKSKLDARRSLPDKGAGAHQLPKSREMPEKPKALIRKGAVLRPKPAPRTRSVGRTKPNRVKVTEKMRSTAGEDERLPPKVSESSRSILSLPKEVVSNSSSASSIHIEQVMEGLSFDMNSNNTATGGNILVPANNKTAESLVWQMNNMNAKWSAMSPEKLLSSPDRSFLLKVDEVEKRNLKENDELVEFEILEKAAEDTSFCSTSSVVIRALQYHGNLTQPSFVTPRKKLPTRSLPQISEQTSDVNGLKTTDVRLPTSSSSPVEVHLLLDVLGTGSNGTDEPEVKPEQGPKPDCLRDELQTKRDETLASGLDPEEIDIVIDPANMAMNGILKVISKDEGSPLSSDSSSKYDDLGASSPSEGFEFQDNETWTDTDGNVSREAVIQVKPRKKKAKHASSASGVLMKYFPALQKKKSPSKNKPVSSPTIIALDDETKTSKLKGLTQQDLCLKMTELEKEVERFRGLSNTLDKLNQQHNESVKRLEKEAVEFEKYKLSEKKKLYALLEEEKKKLRREKQLNDQFLKTRTRTDRRDREELQILRKQVEDLQAELKKKEVRWLATQKRLQDRIRLLDTENADVKREMQEQEKQRLQAQKRQQSPPGRKMIIKCDSPPLAVATNTVPALNGVSHSPPVSPGSSLELRPAEREARSTANTSSQSSGQRSPSEWPTNESSQYQSFNDNRQTTSTNSALVATLEFDPSISLIEKSDARIEEYQHSDGAVEHIFASRKRRITYPNGTRKEISSDGQSVLVLFFNGDVKHTFPDRRIIYYFAENKTTHTTYPDGLQVYHFPNDQLEKHYPDGTKEITFPNQSVKFLFADGSEESVLVDGTIIRSIPSGNRVIQFPNGQKEIHTKEYKKREYPDGTIKYLFPDGRQETRYANGRIRIKDKDGNLVLDSHFCDT